MSEKPATFQFDLIQNESPEVEIEIGGILPDSYKKVKAIIDTGFTGFAQFPLAIGIETKLVLWGIQRYTLADDSANFTLECAGAIRFLGKEISGIVSLSFKGNSCLLGMQFLEQLGMDLNLSTKRKEMAFIPLLEEKSIKDISKKEKSRPDKAAQVSKIAS